MVVNGGFDFEHFQHGELQALPYSALELTATDVSTLPPLWLVVVLIVTPHRRVTWHSKSLNPRIHITLVFLYVP